MKWRLLDVDLFWDEKAAEKNFIEQAMLKKIVPDESPSPDIPYHIEIFITGLVGFWHLVFRRIYINPDSLWLDISNASYWFKI